MSKIINVGLRDRLKKLHSEIYDLLGSEEFDSERDKCEKLMDKDINDELSEEEIDYCLLFCLDNLRCFINDVS